MASKVPQSEILDDEGLHSSENDWEKAVCFYNFAKKSEERIIDGNLENSIAKTKKIKIKLQLINLLWKINE